MAAGDDNMASWPTGREGKRAWLDSVSTRTICGWQGCEEAFEGTLVENREALAAHRDEAHPDFVPYKRPRRPRTKK